MKVGAIALIDYLGFKGIWNEVPPNELIKSLRNLELFLKDPSSSTIRGFHFSREVYPHNSKINIRFLSDCLCITATSRLKIAETPLACKLDALVAVIVAVSQASALSSQLPKPLSFRGCISSGELHVSGNFIIGPAVDEAASMMDKANGAFCWLTPKSKEFLDFCEQSPDELLKENFSGINNPFRIDMMNQVSDYFLLRNYPVPLKNSAVVVSHVVSPLSMDGWGFGAELVRNKILESFQSDSPKVKTKLNYTRNFLENVSTGA